MARMRGEMPLFALWKSWRGSHLSTPLKTRYKHTCIHTCTLICLAPGPVYACLLPLCAVTWLVFVRVFLHVRVYVSVCRTPSWWFSPCRVAACCMRRSRLPASCAARGSSWSRPSLWSCSSTKMLMSSTRTRLSHICHPGATHIQVCFGPHLLYFKYGFQYYMAFGFWFNFSFILARMRFSFLFVFFIYYSNATTTVIV